MTNETITEQITVNIRTKEQLFDSFMSFVKNGGLFIPTTRDFNIGDEMMLHVNLIDETTPFEVASKVVWVTPPGAQRGMTPGIGLQFIDEKSGKLLHNKISTYIAGLSESDNRTETM